MSVGFFISDFFFQIRTKTQCYQFGTESGVELVEWISAIQTAAFCSCQHESDKLSDDVFALPVGDTMEEVENSIYSGVSSSKFFFLTMGCYQPN